MYDFNMEDVLSHGLLDISSVLKINWEITSHCNYNCSYCFGNAGMKNANFSSFEDLKKIVDKIFSINRKAYDILLIGGEPSVHPNFLDLLQYINNVDKDISINIVTNGSKSIEYHKKLFDSIKNKKLLFNVSIHLEHCRLNHLIDLIKLANEYNVFLVFSLMLHPEKFELIEEFLSSFIELRKDFFFDISFRELRQAPNFDRNDERYTDKHYNWIDNANLRWESAVKNSKAKKIEYFSYLPHRGRYNIIKSGKIIRDIDVDYGISIRKGLKSFNGFYCFAGSNYINIHHNNRYSFAIQCPQYSNLGSFLDYDPNNHSICQICRQYQCGCDSNDVIPKFRNTYEASKFISENINYYSTSLINTLIDIRYNQISNSDNNINNQNQNQIRNLDNKISNLDNKISNVINKLAWWIPVKKWRDDFRNKMLNTNNG